MDLRGMIESTFEGKAFERPLFYSYPGGLRFELSQGGSAITQFLLAIRKAELICSSIFTEPDSLVVCFRALAQGNQFAHRSFITELQTAGIRIPRDRTLWLEQIDADDWLEENRPEWYIYLAFQAPLPLIQNALWCAFSDDLAITPNPGCSVYLFNLQKGVMVFPYDDRGMDVVGPNHEFLLRLYSTHFGKLLQYDMTAMQESFGAPSNNSFKPRSLRGRGVVR